MTQRATTKMSEPAKRWVKRTVAFVVTLGSVAAAITALKALWPEPGPADPQDSAALTIEVVSDVPLTEFAQRQQLTARLLAQPTDDVTVDPDNETPVTDVPGCPVQDDCTTEQTDVTVEVPTEDQPGPITEEPGPARHGATPSTGDGLEHTAPPGVLRDVCDEPSAHCSDVNGGVMEDASNALQMVAAGNDVDESGHQVPPAVAARRILGVLSDTRRSEAQEPLGAVVNVNAVLAGLRDRPVQLTWSMWQADGGGRLHGSWLNEHLVYRLVPDTDRDTATVDLWVPLPTARGPFRLFVYASLDGSRLASDRSEPFE